MIVWKFSFKLYIFSFSKILPVNHNTTPSPLIIDPIHYHIEEQMFFFILLQISVRVNQNSIPFFFKFMTLVLIPQHSQGRCAYIFPIVL